MWDWLKAPWSGGPKWQLPNMNWAPVISAIYTDIFIFSSLPLSPSIDWTQFRLPLKDAMLRLVEAAREVLPVFSISLPEWLYDACETLIRWLPLPDVLGFFRGILSYILLQFEMWDMDIPFIYVWGTSVILAIVFSLYYWLQLLQPVKGCVKTIHTLQIRLSELDKNRLLKTEKALQKGIAEVDKQKQEQQKAQAARQAAVDNVDSAELERERKQAEANEMKAKEDAADEAVKDAEGRLKTSEEQVQQLNKEVEETQRAHSQAEAKAAKWASRQFRDRNTNALACEKISAIMPVATAHLEVLAEEKVHIALTAIKERELEVEPITLRVNDVFLDWKRKEDEAKIKEKEVEAKSSHSIGAKREAFEKAQTEMVGVVGSLTEHQSGLREARAQLSVAKHAEEDAIQEESDADSRCNEKQREHDRLSEVMEKAKGIESDAEHQLISLRSALKEEQIQLSTQTENSENSKAELAKTRTALQGRQAAVEEIRQKLRQAEEKHAQAQLVKTSAQSELQAKEREVTIQLGVQDECKEQVDAANEARTKLINDEVKKQNKGKLPILHTFVTAADITVPQEQEEKIRSCERALADEKDHTKALQQESKAAADDLERATQEVEKCASTVDDMKSKLARAIEERDVAQKASEMQEGKHGEDFKSVEKATKAFAEATTKVDEAQAKLERASSSYQEAQDILKESFKALTSAKEFLAGCRIDKASKSVACNKAREAERKARALVEQTTQQQRKVKETHDKALSILKTAQAKAKEEAKEEIPERAQATKLQEQLDQLRADQQKAFAAVYDSHSRLWKQTQEEAHHAFHTDAFTITSWERLQRAFQEGVDEVTAEKNTEIQADTIKGAYARWDNLKGTCKEVTNELEQIKLDLMTVQSAKQKHAATAEEVTNGLQQIKLDLMTVKSKKQNHAATRDRHKDAVKEEAECAAELDHRKQIQEEKEGALRQIEMKLTALQRDRDALQVMVKELQESKEQDNVERETLLLRYDETVTKRINESTEPWKTNVLFLVTETFFIPMLRWLVQVFDCSHGVESPCELYLDVHTELQCFVSWQHSFITPFAAFAIIALYPAAAVARAFLQLMVCISSPVTHIPLASHNLKMMHAANWCSQDKNKTIYIQQRYTFIHTNMLIALMVTEVLTGALPWPKLIVCFSLSLLMLFVTLTNRDHTGALNACTWNGLIRIKILGFSMAACLSLAAMVVQYMMEHQDERTWAVIAFVDLIAAVFALNIAIRLFTILLRGALDTADEYRDDMEPREDLNEKFAPAIENVQRRYRNKPAQAYARELRVRLQKLLEWFGISNNWRKFLFKGAMACVFLTTLLASIQEEPVTVMPTLPPMPPNLPPPLLPSPMPNSPVPSPSPSLPPPTPPQPPSPPPPVEPPTVPSSSPNLPPPPPSRPPSPLPPPPPAPPRPSPPPPVPPPPQPPSLSRPSSPPQLLPSPHIPMVDLRTAIDSQWKKLLAHLEVLALFLGLLGATIWDTLESVGKCMNELRKKIVWFYGKVKDEMRKRMGYTAVSEFPAMPLAKPLPPPLERVSSHPRFSAAARRSVAAPSIQTPSSPSPRMNEFWSKSTSPHRDRLRKQFSDDEITMSALMVRFFWQLTLTDFELTLTSCLL